MSHATATSMDALAIDEFVGSQQTGVLAIGAGGGVYAIPVSFAYKDDGPAFYFRLGYGPDSQKREYVDAAEEATFVVYDQTAAGWKSVIAEGRLERVSKDALDRSIVEAVDHLQIPFFQVHRHPTSQLDFVIVRLAVEKLSGITEAHRAQ